MINTINFHIPKLEDMKVYPSELFYIGNTDLLKKPMISIVGSRSPNDYARTLTAELAKKLSQTGNIIVSGGAIGIDTVAHTAAGASNTIMVAGTGLNQRYPAINKKLIQDIETNGLVLSQFPHDIFSNRYNFPLRNELVVALADILIVAYADKNSGTMRSVEYALKMEKEIYVLPHRLGESKATNDLLKNNLAKPIYDIDEFVNMFGQSQKTQPIEDQFLIFCKSNPTYDEAIKKFGAIVFEYELAGKINISNGKITI